MAKVFDTIYDDEMLNLIDWGIEGETYEEVDGTRKRLNGDLSFAELWDKNLSDFDHFALLLLPDHAPQRAHGRNSSAPVPRVGPRKRILS